MTCVHSEQTITLVQIGGGTTINDACAELQGLAESGQQPVAGFFNGRFLLAMPGGHSRNLLAGFFEEDAIGRPILSNKTVSQSDGIQKAGG